MSLFRKGKKNPVPESKDDLGPGRRLGSKEDEAVATSKDVPATTESVNGKPELIDLEDVVDLSEQHEDSRHLPVDPLGDPQPHNAGKKIVKKKITGRRSEAKTLYEGPRICGCCTNWLDEPPEDMHRVRKNRAEHGDYALVIRKTGHGGDDTWKIQSMMVFSPYVMELFRKTLADYPGVATALDQVEFQAPFEPLLHRWPAIDEGLKEEDDLRARNHYNLLRQVVEPELAPHLKARAECEEHAVIPFDSVWTIFPPGTLVIWESDGQSNIGKLVEAGYVSSWSGRVYQVTCDQVDWNGENFGFARRTIKITSFEGTRPVGELAIMPLDLKSNVAEIKKAHIERGRLFETLHGYHFKAYDGPALGLDGWFRKTQKKVRDPTVEQ